MFDDFMRNTWIASTLVAAVAGIVGFFVVVRGASFAAHALPLSAFPGAAAANLLGVNPLVGLLVFSGLGVAGISQLARRGRRDLATALSLVMLLGLGALCLSRTTEYVQAVYALLFGEVLGVGTQDLAPVALLSLLCIALVVALFRPLLLSSVSPDLAAARGIPPRLMEVLFLGVVALATAMALPVVGALLVFSLMVGPASAARSLTDHPLRAMLLSAILAVATVWTAIALSFASDWPVGFFVGALSACAYAAGHLRAGPGAPPPAGGGAAPAPPSFPQPRDTPFSLHIRKECRMHRRLLIAAAALLAGASPLARAQGIGGLEGAYNGASLSLAPGNFAPLQLDQTGSLKVDCLPGCASSTAQGAPNTIANAWPVDPVQSGAAVSATNPLYVQDPFDGAPITAATLPSGGAGIIGWLSAMYRLQSGTLTVAGTVSVAGITGAPTSATGSLTAAATVLGAEAANVVRLHFTVVNFAAAQGASLYCTDDGSTPSTTNAAFIVYAQGFYERDTPAWVLSAAIACIPSSGTVAYRAESYP